MGAVRKTVTFTEEQDSWIKAQISAGDFANDSEYLRNLVRNDQAKNAKFLALKMEVQKGLDSGISENSVPDIMERVEAKLNRPISLSQ